MNKFYVEQNEENECYRILERDGIVDDGVKEDSVVADFYQSDGLMAETVTKLLNATH